MIYSSRRLVVIAWNKSLLHLQSSLATDRQPQIQAAPLLIFPNLLLPLKFVYEFYSRIRNAQRLETRRDKILVEEKKTSLNYFLSLCIYNLRLIYLRTDKLRGKLKAVEEEYKIGGYV